jgi:hypothetical protein
MAECATLSRRERCSLAAKVQVQEVVQTPVPLLRNLLFSREFSGISILGLVKKKFRINAEKMVTVTRRPSR